MSSEDSYSGLSCNYSSLGKYNAGYSMGAKFNKVQGDSPSVMLLPAWGQPGFDLLTSDKPSCSGYRSMDSAYLSEPGVCQSSYRAGLCGASDNSTSKFKSAMRAMQS